MEVWREVVGWRGYEVSSAGRIRSWKVCKNRPREPLPRMMAMFMDKKGYSCIKLKDHKRRRGCAVHVLIAEAFLGPRPPGMEVAHWDGNPSNNAISNLRYATPSENADDTLRYGRRQLGENRPNATVSNSTAKDIKEFLGTHAECARHFGVNYYTAYWIRTGRTWARVL